MKFDNKSMIRSLFCFAVLWPVTVRPVAADVMKLTRDGVTDHRIVLPIDAAPVERAVADELANFLKKICDATFPTVTDDVDTGDVEIILARNLHLDKLGIKPEFEKLGREGYQLLTNGRHLVIAGRPWRGTINGVYGFLQNVLGCRWYHPPVNVIPRQTELTIPALNRIEISAYQARNIYCWAAVDLDWAARVRFNYFTRDIGHVRDNSWVELQADPL